MDKPVSQPCLRNQQAICEALQAHFAEVGSVLEVGSGTGQHAVYMARHLPHLKWQPSDLAPALPGIELWRQEAALDNVLPPLVLDVTSNPWPLSDRYGGAFTANTLHFVGWSVVEALLAGVATHLASGAVFCAYGPFNRDGQYTSEGNRELDVWLRERDPDSGIKDMADIASRSARVGLVLQGEDAMPANNLLLRFIRT
ncbi:class I SAM-dependent methyltransferase [Aestuariirhabdus sp. Z084]|uniref:DUF938 domain-containing protein n=1 Tax=Aestuariirhabdus haliotis TaxID=2918751 RepID=UPI00201B4510|nr:DUF938 domain-containing protein [Aestuariirhabdus haliotis]MCL6415530.1 class I SAM-dependent methyltransferase [Aestuariirhabdus haliotis]MCL6419265.1 class I SAM-dependent methyltransferase [Aestuariirhabdus haliotis]